MRVDTLWKNIGSYILFAALSVAVGVLQDFHRQIVNGGPFDYWLMLDAGVVVIAPILTNAVLNMKLPSVGHEPIAAKVDAHEDRLRVGDPPGPVAGADRSRRRDDPPPAWLPPDPSGPVPMPAYGPGPPDPDGR